MYHIRLTLCIMKSFQNWVSSTFEVNQLDVLLKSGTDTCLPTPSHDFIHAAHAALVLLSAGRPAKCREERVTASGRSQDGPYWRDLPALLRPSLNRTTGTVQERSGHSRWAVSSWARPAWLLTSASIQSYRQIWKPGRRQ